MPKFHFHTLGFRAMMRNHHLHSRYSRAQSQHGFSLVELLVALALSMLIVIATTYVYLGTRETQRALFEKAYATETAKYALDVIGRDIENAGFYPSSSEAGLIKPYTNPKVSNPPAAFDAMLFGCEDQKFDPSSVSPACVNHTGSVAGDTLVLNSYSNDAAGLNVGNRADCLRQDSANDDLNSARRNLGHATATAANRPFLTPIQPLFVSNRYTLVTTALQVEGQDINTFSLACNGNGKNPSDSVYQPIVAGIDQLRFYYLERTASTTNSQFQRASGVTSWSSVVAIRVCLMSRSMQSAKLQGNTSYETTNCDGVTQSFTDGIERKIYSQTFALKNHSQITNP